MKKIIYIQYTNPGGYPPLEHSSRILANSGWQVLFLGTGAFGNATTLYFPYHPHIRVKRMSFCPGGWKQKLHYLLFCFWVFAWAIFWRPQWLYASDLFSCPITLVLSFLGFRVIYHEHDTPCGFSRNIFIRFCLKMRRWLARRAKWCVVPNRKRAKYFSEEMLNGNHVICVWNCPAQEEIASPRSAWEDGDLWVFYHGSIVPSRLPIIVLEALALLPGCVKLRVAGYETIGHPEYVRQLQERSSQRGVDGRVEIIGAMSRHEMWQYVQECDVGLSLMPQWSEDLNLRFMVGASNKSFDYLACGLPLLVTDLSDWKKMYVEAGYGLACDPDDPKSIADALGWFLDHPKEMREMGERGRRRVLKEWNYEQQFLPVFERLQDGQ